MEQFKVLPKTPVHAQKIRLSVQDAYSPKLWVTQTHFWQSKSPESFEKSYDLLREGLSRLVTEFPGLLGKIGRRSANPTDLQIVVDADAGVEFSHEDISGHDGVQCYQGYKAQGFPVTFLSAITSPTITLTPVSEGSPMFAAKLNKLTGGIALTFGFNHLFADASGIAELEKLWALHTADAGAGRKRTHKTQVDAEQIRLRLSSPVVGADQFNESHWAEFPTEKSQLNLPKEEVSKEAAMAMLEAAKRDHVASVNGNVKTLKWCLWYFSPESLATLKQNTPGSDCTKWISTMDALIGLCWSRIARIKQNSREGHEISTIAFPINIRTRLDPPVESSYIGNLVDILCTGCSLTELESNTTGVAVAAQSIRKGIESWSQRKWEAWLSLVCSLPPEKAVCPNPVLMLANQNLVFNDYSKSQSNTLDWGPDLGRIDRTRYLRPAASMIGCATCIVVYPGLPDGGLEVATTCDEDVQAALEKDATFQRYAKLTTAFE